MSSFTPQEQPPAFVSICGTVTYNYSTMDNERKIFDQLPREVQRQFPSMIASQIEELRQNLRALGEDPDAPQVGNHIHRIDPAKPADPPAIPRVQPPTPAEAKFSEPPEEVPEHLLHTLEQKILQALGSGPMNLADLHLKAGRAHFPVFIPRSMHFAPTAISPTGLPFRQSGMPASK